MEGLGESGLSELGSGLSLSKMVGIAPFLTRTGGEGGGMSGDTGACG